MPSHASSIQNLPLIIVRAVVGYVVDQFKASYKFNESTVISLLHVSPVWRATTLKIAFSDITLRIDQSHSLTARFHISSKLSIPIDQFDHSLVGILRIETNDDIDIPNSTFASWIKLVDPSVLHFSNVDSIHILISTSLDPKSSNGSGRGYDNSNRNANKAIDAILPYELALSFTDFLHNTRVIVPNISMAYISLDIATDSDFPSNFSKVVDHWVINFMRGVKKVIFTSTKNSLYPQINESWFTELQLLDFCLLKHSGFTKIARLNSNTLEDLDICCVSALASGLLYTENAQPIIYSSLEKLVFRDDCTDATVTPRNIPEFDDDTPTIVHFPVIKSLHMLDIYPFAYNVLAQDINESLKHMQVSLFNRGDQLVGLNEFKILLSSKFISLESLYVSITHKNGVNELTGSESTSAVETVVQSLSSCTLYLLRVNSNAKSDSIPSMIISSVKLNSLNHLDYSHVYLSFSDILFLLNSAQYLKVVKFSLKPTDTIVENMSPNEILDYIKTRIVPLYSHVRSILILKSELTNKQMAQMLVLLVIACPDITKISIKNLKKAEMINEISTLLSDYPFASYFGQCGKLLKIIQS